MTEHVADTADVARSLPSEISLSITFTGPLLFDFHKGSDTTVDVYAPYCPYHEAGVFFSYSSFSETNLWQCVQQKEGSLPPAERAYTIYGEGIEACATTPQILNPIYPSDFIHPDGTRLLLSASALGGLNLRSDKAVFRISVPRPEFVYPLYHDSVEVVPDYNPGSAKGNLTAHSTGLRFFYKWNANTPVVLKLPRNHFCIVTPPIFDGLPSLADIEIRYQGLEITDQNDSHADARSCFSSLMTLAGLTSWLNYGDGKSTPTNPSPAPPMGSGDPGPCVGVDKKSESRFQILIHTGGDCQAPIIVNGLDGV